MTDIQRMTFITNNWKWAFGAEKPRFSGDSQTFAVETMPLLASPTSAKGQWRLSRNSPVEAETAEEMDSVAMTVSWLHWLHWLDSLSCSPANHSKNDTHIVFVLLEMIPFLLLYNRTTLREIEEGHVFVMPAFVHMWALEKEPSWCGLKCWVDHMLKMNGSHKVDQIHMGWLSLRRV